MYHEPLPVSLLGYQLSVPVCQYSKFQNMSTHAMRTSSLLNLHRNFSDVPVYNDVKAILSRAVNVENNAMLLASFVEVKNPN